VNDRNFTVIIRVGIGTVIGIIAFSQILSWLLKHWHDLTVAFLTGLMIGSLRKIWPWKVEEANVIPDSLSKEVFMSFILIIIGITVVLVIEKLSEKNAINTRNAKNS
jgi:putative membrane protein